MNSAKKLTIVFFLFITFTAFSQNPVNVIQNAPFILMEPNWEEVRLADSLNPGNRVSIPFLKTNGGDFPKYSVASTGVIGLVATLEGSKFSRGAGFLRFNITGIAGNSGLANFEINFARARCTFQLDVLPPVGTLTNLNCSSAAHSGVLFSGVLSNGVSSSVSYSGGNGGTYNSQAIASTGVTGLTANLMEGVLTNGSGNLIFFISSSLNFSFSIFSNSFFALSTVS